MSTWSSRKGPPGWEEQPCKAGCWGRECRGEQRPRGHGLDTEPGFLPLDQALTLSQSGCWAFYLPASRLWVPCRLGARARLSE